MADAKSDSQPEPCNCAALRQATRRVTKLYDDALASVGIGVNQYSILGRLNRLGPSAIQDLARALVMDRSTLGHLLRPLESRGLLRLETSKKDRRGRVVAITPAGRDLIAQARPLWALAQRRFEKRIGGETALTLRTLLQQVADQDFGRAATTESEK